MEDAKETDSTVSETVCVAEEDMGAVGQHETPTALTRVRAPGLLYEEAIVCRLAGGLRAMNAEELDTVAGRDRGATLCAPVGPGPGPLLARARALLHIRQSRDRLAVAPVRARLAVLGEVPVEMILGIADPDRRRHDLSLHRSCCVYQILCYTATKYSAGFL